MLSPTLRRMSTALAVLAAARIAVAAPAPTPLRLLLGRPLIEGNRPSGAKLSPDGRRVAFVWNDHGERSPRDLWVSDADGSGAPRNLTRFADPTPEAPGQARPWKPKKGDEPRRRSVDAFDWAVSSDRLVLTSGGDLWLAPLAGEIQRLTDTEAAESDPKNAPDGRGFLYESVGDLFLWSLAGGPRTTVTQLTKHEENQSFGDAVWSPASDRIACIKRNEKDRFDLVVPDYLKEKVEAGKSRGGWQSETAVIISVTGGEPFVPDLGEAAPESILALRFSPDRKRLLVDGQSRDMKTRTLHIVEELGALAPPKVRLLYKETDAAWAFTNDGIFSREVATAFSPDGTLVMFLSEKSGFAQPWVVLVVGASEARRIGDGSFETTWAGWVGAAGHAALVTLDNSGDPGVRRLHRVDVATAASRPLGELAGLNVDAALSKDGSRVLLTHSRFSEPGELFAIDTEAGAAHQLTHSVPESFARVPWVVPRRIEITSGDGTRLKAMVYEPTGPKPKGGRPAVIFAHGAGYLQNVVDGWSIYSPNFKFHTRLVAKGYVVLEVDYRGSSGYGRAFRTGVYKYLGGKDLEDLVAGARWLKARGDVGRIGVYGGSYGGFLALMAMFREPGWFNAGAALRFVADWENYARGNPWYCTERLGKPEDDPEAYRKSSPIHFAEGLKGGLLLLHGMKDNNVHFQDAVQLTSRLIELGKRFEVMMYPREGHGFENPESWLDEYGRIEEFFDRELTPPAPRR